MVFALDTMKSRIAIDITNLKKIYVIRVILIHGILVKKLNVYQLI